MRAAISLLVLLLSMSGVQTESQGTDASTQDVSTELKELRDMVVDLRATLQHTQDGVKVLEAENVAMKQRVAASESKVGVLKANNIAMKQRLAASESKVEALERALQDTKAETKTQVDNLKKNNAAQDKELKAVKTRLAATTNKVEKEIKAAPKVAFSAALMDSGSVYTEAGSNDMNLAFKRVITNVGRAYSGTTGIFTAPARGVYYFRFTVMDQLDSAYMFIRMHKNGELLMELWEYGSDGGYTYLSSGLTLQLEKGDAVNMVLPKGKRLIDGYVNHCTFSGFLLFPL